MFAGRIIGGMWAINFLLLISETLTLDEQNQISLSLAIDAVALLFKRYQGAEKHIPHVSTVRRCACMTGPVSKVWSAP